MNKQIESLIIDIARQYLNRYGNKYRHTDVCLPLDMDVLTTAVEILIFSNRPFQHGGKEGQLRVLVFLTAMYTDGKLNDEGIDMLDYVLRAFCENISFMLDVSHVPANVIGRSTNIIVHKSDLTETKA